MLGFILFLNFYYDLFSLYKSVSSLFWIISFFIIIILIGFNKDKYIYKIDIIQLVFIYTFCYLIFIYILGIILGFSTSPYTHSISNIIKNSFFAVLLIIFQELFRYTVIAKENKRLNLLVTVLIIIFDIVLGLNLYDVMLVTDVFKLFALIIIPSICRNTLLTFLTIKAGYLPSILYRIILTMYIYILPIFPDLGIYLESIFYIVLPMIIYLRINKLLDKQVRKNNYQKRTLKAVLTMPLFAISILIICLVSGLFKYTILAIGSNSMYPYIKKGDVIIFEKTSNYQSFKEKDILLYNYNNKIIVHRIVDIKQSTGKYVFFTKGDNNKTIDNYPIYENMIVGKGITKIPFVGFPSVWFSEVID